MDPQAQINTHFDSVSRHWGELYGESTLEGAIHRDRLSMTLSWIDELGAENGARVVDVGCGAGVAAIELAQRGYDVWCVDPSSSMVELTQAEVVRAGVTESVFASTGDAHSLDLADGSCDVVIALGVIPYLHSPLKAASEMARVLKPGSYAILSSDNLFRLNRVLDPRYTPFLPARSTLRRGVRRVRPAPSEELESQFFSLRTVNTLLHRAGLNVERWSTLGFGPFTLLGRRIFSEERGIAIHRRLQILADRRIPVLRAVGAQHLLLARTKQA